MPFFLTIWCTFDAYSSFAYPQSFVKCLLFGTFLSVVLMWFNPIGPPSGRIPSYSGTSVLRAAIGGYHLPFFYQDGLHIFCVDAVTKRRKVVNRESFWDRADGNS